MAAALVFWLLSAASVVAALTPRDYPLPSYVGQACGRRDPKLAECIVRKGNQVIHKVSQGDPKYRIPKFNPLTLDEMRVGRGTQQVGMTLSCTKCKLFGLQNAKFINADVNMDQGRVKWDFMLDELQIKGEYKVEGKILLLPITGSGLANFSMTDLRFSYMFNFTTFKESNGKEYIKLLNHDLTANVSKMTMHLDNLFNGDRLLGDAMNNFLNENWQEFVKEVLPGFLLTLGTILTSILNGMAELIPYDTLFPLK